MLLFRLPLCCSRKKRKKNPHTCRQMPEHAIQWSCCWTNQSLSVTLCTLKKTREVYQESLKLWCLKTRYRLMVIPLFFYFLEVGHKENRSQMHVADRFLPGTVWSNLRYSAHCPAPWKGHAKKTAFIIIIIAFSSSRLWRSSDTTVFLNII